MGFKQKLSEKNLILHFWILSSAKLAMRAVSSVGNEEYPLIEFKIKQVVIWKNWTHLQGRVLGIIFVCILLLKHHNLLNYLIRVAFWVLLHAIHVRLKTTDKVIRKRFWQTVKTKRYNSMKHLKGQQSLFTTTCIIWERRVPENFESWIKPCRFLLKF